MPRYECDDPQFAGNYIEYSDAWSMREANSLSDGALAQMVTSAALKVVALHLDTTNGDPITEAQDFTSDMLEDVDLRLYYWVVGTFAKIPGDLGKLGEALRRTLFVSSVATDGAPPAAS